MPGLAQVIAHSKANQNTAANVLSNKSASGPVLKTPSILLFNLLNLWGIIIIIITTFRMSKPSHGAIRELAPGRCDLAESGVGVVSEDSWKALSKPSEPARSPPVPVHLAVPLTRLLDAATFRGPE